jgi:dTDP-4-amino-4,6-dideoxygalactose transaminase
MNIDPASVEAAITSRTRAILVVHFAGRPCDMNALMAIARRHDLVLIEDCAHAVESTYYGRPVGTLGAFGCFSFYATKNVTTGEGGMIIASSDEALQQCRVLSLHGMSADAWMRFSSTGYKHYKVVAAGFKYNMMDLQAAIGIHQLKSIESHWQRRLEIWERYTAALGDLPLTLPSPVESGCRHGYHLYTILIDPASAPVTRDEFLARMAEKRIGVGVHYESIAAHPFYKQAFGWRLEDQPIAALIGDRTVSLPLMPSLLDDDVDYVIEAIRMILQSPRC